MWLSIVLLIGGLSKILGINFPEGSSNKTVHHPCITKILECDYYRQPFSIFQDKYIVMFTNIEDLQKACKNQTAYIQCMARAEEFCKESMAQPEEFWNVHFPMAVEMIKSRRFPADLCRPMSPWQQMYLREAKCLNVHIRKASEHCFEGMRRIKYLYLATNSKLSCAYFKAIADCSVELLQEKCGHYAAYIVKKLLTFHDRYDYKCFDFDIATEDDLPTSIPDYGTTDPVSTIFEGDSFHKNTDHMNTDFEEATQNSLENPVSDNPLLEESTAVVDFENLFPEERQQTTESSVPGEFDVNLESADINMKQEGHDFPALPQHDYLHKNKTTFALYEDLEMGHMKYIGCGEADIFWVILSPPKSKYCTLMDLNSEYSDSLFKCTIRIDAPCSPELNDEDEQKNAEVFHRRYAITVLSPPNNRRLEDMAIMNLHYLKVYPTSSMYGEGRKTNLWSNQEHKDEEDEPVNRKGPLEMQDNPNINYQYGNGSGQKDKNILKHSHDFNEDEEYENWDYYPLEEDDDDIYFPESLGNEVIYIEDVNGDLISLHDHRSPIYSHSLYRPNSLFRPRIGAMPASRDPQKFGEEAKKKLHQNSIFEERISELNDKTSEKDDFVNRCSSEVPCPPDSETISKLGIEHGMYIDIRNVKTFDPFKGLNLNRQRPVKFSTKLDDIFADLHPGFTETYVVTPSDTIILPNSEELKYPDKHHNDEFVTCPSKYLSEVEGVSSIIDTTDDS